MRWARPVLSAPPGQVGGVLEPPHPGAQSTWTKCLRLPQKLPKIHTFEPIPRVPFPERWPRNGLCFHWEPLPLENECSPPFCGNGTCPNGGGTTTGCTTDHGCCESAVRSIALVEHWWSSHPPRAPASKNRAPMGPQAPAQQQTIGWYRGGLKIGLIARIVRPPGAQPCVDLGGGMPSMAWLDGLAR